MPEFLYKKTGGGGRNGLGVEPWRFKLYVFICANRERRKLAKTSALMETDAALRQRFSGTMHGDL